MNKKLIAVLLAALLLPALGRASEENVHLDKANIDVSDKAALQRGAKYFVNYCLSCHSAKYMRYNRLVKDLDLTPEQVKQNLIMTNRKIGQTMEVALRPVDGKKWFGNPPPDLSVIARQRGADWLYTYLRSFYLDPSRPTGVNNVVFPKVAMPDVLWELQGWQEPVYKTVELEDGQKEQVIDHLKLVAPGKMTPPQYDQMVRDLVTYLAYMGEPRQVLRKEMGVWVLLFLGLLFVVAYLLKKEYWKDLH
ncbi:MAG: cytochrome c1 [Gammaproteobacteria bacterium]|jgi:ubiquinol-cytochrome c reductase cytochrome c1 subunit